MKPLLTARDVMCSSVLRVRDDMKVAALSALPGVQGICAMPVQDAFGRWVGVVAASDLVLAAEAPVAPGRHELPDFFRREPDGAGGFDARQLAGLRASNLLVRDVMTRGVYSVPADSPVADVADIMRDGHMNRLLVTIGSQVVGIVSASDLLGLLVELD